MNGTRLTGTPWRCMAGSNLIVHKAMTFSVIHRDPNPRAHKLSSFVHYSWPISGRATLRRPHSARGIRLTRESRPFTRVECSLSLRPVDAPRTAADFVEHARDGARAPSAAHLHVEDVLLCGKGSSEGGTGYSTFAHNNEQRTATHMSPCPLRTCAMVQTTVKQSNSSSRASVLYTFAGLRDK